MSLHPSGPIDELDCEHVILCHLLIELLKQAAQLLSGGRVQSQDFS